MGTWKWCKASAPPTAVCTIAYVGQLYSLWLVASTLYTSTTEFLEITFQPVLLRPIHLSRGLKVHLRHVWRRRPPLIAREIPAPWRSNQ